MRTVLVIDDNPAVGTALDVLFGLRDIKTVIATSPEEGLAVLARERIDLVVQDMNFSADTTSGEEGIELYRAIRRDHSDLPIILLTAWTRLETAVELVKAGAGDYLGKPWDDNKLLATVENLLELSEATREVSRFREERRRRRRQLDDRYDLRGIVYASGGMERVVELACQVARADVPVLITGPNGAGKERIAEIVQANSARAKGPFITVNCGALPSELIEAELFGADPGAYTGAPNRAREGRFEAADGGTLFLDEIGNLPLAGQMKLLRILETGQFERLGSSKTRQVAVRVISATNADLPAKIRDGSFREDLYYRLNVIELRLPPLAERSDDILPLAEHFLQGRASLDSGARSALLAHAWPGNVRELKNAIERASLLCSDATITARDLDLGPARLGGGRLPAEAEPDKGMIEAALQRARGVISQAASDLGLSRQALYRRMEKMGIET
ncbi:sigma-54-dependent transcriptional regulator [Dokdonella immobilis]|uniref:DNA-binding transcriptional response regulator, NtrC family, contains REC, AAA-type ATPase, and a Fis-type DNA-binding domains n=1 Tax=Dokdonella immobilis TaxID=578942 RepID=A0A1I4YYW8_9GAMM|nr:sigma-54 dependent transcriptional regulator [Dokdonella immobilis]SFN43194.1 DNA-binding transcriptional response regulator, NtrC family, contains REC, AAA-type ATPase, and a Fis-type DNA-binding domains [Dokdonella immobilis]